MSETEKYSKFQTTDEFILDREFVHWVLSPTPEQNLFWSRFRKLHPEKEQFIQDALLIISAIQPKAEALPEGRMNEILEHIRTNSRQRRIRTAFFLRIAAGFIVLCTIGTLWFTLSQRTEEQFFAVPSQAALENGRVILSSGEVKEFKSRETLITQTADGHLIVDKDTLSVKEDSEEQKMNQIIVPYGERSDIQLADGTHIWLNSGSQLSYPTKFNKNSREDFLVGEAYFAVAHNSNSPFYVNTKEMKIKVLGTEFNVTSYADDQTVQAVLVNGKITAGKQSLFSDNYEMKPGERLVYDKSAENITKDQVDVRLYSSWKEGYLIFEKMPLQTVFTILRRYYNKELVVENGLETLTFSGKLDLEDKLPVVLEDIAFASSVKIDETEGGYTIKR